MSRPTPTRQRFGRYETLFRFASGGMAEVFAARATGAAGFERLVALKRILPNMNDDERVIDMFMDEGRLAANVTSSHVVSTLDLGRADDGSLYIVMDLVIGAPLSRLMASAAGKSDPSPSIATEIICQAARGLHDAHEATTPAGEPLNLIHRDVSPQNILVGADGRVQITDFGIARSERRRTQTSTGEFKGKLTYYSPEQTANRPLDRRCDIFALGIVAWEVLTGQRLFAADNPLAVLDQVMNMPIVPPHEVRPEVPEAISAVIMKALERDRDARYQTAAELEEALRAAAASSLPHCTRADLRAFVSAYSGETLERIQAELKAALAQSDGSSEEERTPPRAAGYTWLLRAGAVAAVVALAAGVALVMNEADRAASPAPSIEAPTPTATPAVAASPAPPAEIAPSPPIAEPAPEPAPRRSVLHRSARRSRRARAEAPSTAPAPVAAQEQPPEPAPPRLGANRAPILR